MLIITVSKMIKISKKLASIFATSEVYNGYKITYPITMEDPHVWNIQN